MKKTLLIKILLLAAVFAALLSVTENVRADGTTVDLGDVKQMGDYQGTTHYIVFYPEELETSDGAWPVAVFRNGGSLSKDGSWTGYAARNLTNNNVTASAFSDGSIWRAAALFELMVIVAGLSVILAKRKKVK